MDRPEPSPSPSATILGRVAVGLGVCFGLAWLARLNPGVFVLCFFAVVYGYTFQITRAKAVGDRPPRGRPRFTIGQVMVVVAIVSVPAAVARWMAQGYIESQVRRGVARADVALFSPAIVAGFLMATGVAGYLGWLALAPWWGLLVGRRNGGSLFGPSKAEREGGTGSVLRPHVSGTATGTGSEYRTRATPPEDEGRKRDYAPAPEADDIADRPARSGPRPER